MGFFIYTMKARLIRSATTIPSSRASKQLAEFMRSQKDEAVLPPVYAKAKATRQPSLPARPCALGVCFVASLVLASASAS